MRGGLEHRLDSEGPMVCGGSLTVGAEGRLRSSLGATAQGDWCGSANPGCGVEEGLGVRLRSMLLIGLAITRSGSLVTREFGGLGCHGPRENWVKLRVPQRRGEHEISKEGKTGSRLC